MKFPRQCPLVLPVKVGWREGNTFGCEEAEEREKEHNFVRRFPGYARSSFW
jgi:hypothetical protein